MLIEFRVKNFRSFHDTQILSMVAGSGTEHLSTHSFDSKISNFNRLLASSVIYGANAAGKTNLLRALQFMQSIIVNSQLVGPSAQLPYTPFKFDAVSREAPSEFEVTFAENGSRYQYGFSMDTLRIHHEWLIEYRTKNPARMFERIYDPVKGKYEWSFSALLKGNRSVWRDATRQNALFLSTAIQLNSLQLLNVYWWFQKRLIIIANNTTFNVGMTLRLLDEKAGKERLLPFMREADLAIEDVQVSRKPLSSGPMVIEGQPLIYQDSPTSPLTMAKVTFSHHSREMGESVPLDLADESSGTQTLFRNAGAWLNVFANGEVLVVDEIDANLHTLLVRYLINRFHSNATNPNNSQLIFSTHNVSLLNQEMFRRDQIWFVEKNDDNISRLYSLSEFSPRKDEVLERWYLRGRYGALPVLGER